MLIDHKFSGNHGEITLRCCLPAGEGPRGGWQWHACLPTGKGQSRWLIRVGAGLDPCAPLSVHMLRWLVKQVLKRCWLQSLGRLQETGGVDTGQALPGSVPV